MRFAISVLQKNRVLQDIFREKPLFASPFLANEGGCWQIHRKFLRILERDVLGLDRVREKDRGRIGEFLCRLGGEILATATKRKGLTDTRMAHEIILERRGYNIALCNRLCDRVVRG